MSSSLSRGSVWGRGSCSLSGVLVVLVVDVFGIKAQTVAIEFPLQLVAEADCDGGGDNP